VANSTTIDFNDESAPDTGAATYSSSSGIPKVVVGGASGLYAAPPADETSYLTIGSFGSETVTISFTQATDYFGFYGGSSDTYNSVAFYNGVSLIQSFDGGENFGGEGTGNQAEGIFFNFFADSPSEYFNRVVLGSTIAAFETDNHAFRSAPTTEAVPEPATMAGLLLLGGAGAWKKRRKAKA
jgi:hypothetical protein